MILATADHGKNRKEETKVRQYNCHCLCVPLKESHNAVGGGSSDIEATNNSLNRSVTSCNTALSHLGAKHLLLPSLTLRTSWRRRTGPTLGGGCLKLLFELLALCDARLWGLAAVSLWSISSLFPASVSLVPSTSPSPASSSTSSAASPSAASSPAASSPRLTRACLKLKERSEMKKGR